MNTLFFVKTYNHSTNWWARFLVTATEPGQKPASFSRASSAPGGLHNFRGIEMTPLTNQQVFDNALFGVRSQGYRQSKDDRIGTCCYRSGDLKCGIGYSIPDEMYRPYLDDPELGVLPVTGVQTLMEAGDPLLAPIQALFAHNPPDFLDELQCAHDSMRDGREFERLMEALAEDYGLTYTVPEPRVRSISPGVLICVSPT